MILPLTEERKKLIYMDEEEYTAKKKRKNEGGALIFLGVCGLLFGAGNQLFLGVMYDSQTTMIAVTAGCVIAGIALLIWGIRMAGQTGDSNAEFWAKTSGYTVEEMIAFNRECQLPDTVLIHETQTNLRQEDSLATGVLTQHWFRIPHEFKALKLVDIAAIWYEQGTLEGWDPSVFLLRSNGEVLHILAKKHKNEAFGQELINEISKRNPMTITARYFTYEGSNYDAYSNAGEVAALYRRECEKNMHGTK